MKFQRQFQQQRGGLKTTLTARRLYLSLFMCLIFLFCIVYYKFLEKRALAEIK